MRRPLVGYRADNVLDGSYLFLSQFNKKPQDSLIHLLVHTENSGKLVMDPRNEYKWLAATFLISRAATIDNF